MHMAGNEQANARVEENDVSPRAALAAKHGTNNRSVLGGVATFE